MVMDAVGAGSPGPWLADVSRRHRWTPGRWARDLLVL